MRQLFILLTELSGRLDSTNRRILLVLSTAGLTLFAGSTVAAWQADSLPDFVAGLVLLGVFATGAAVASSGRSDEQTTRPT